MSTPPSPEETERAARALLDQRILTVRELAASRQKLHHARTAEAAAARDHAACFQRAMKVGWDPDELKKLGFEEPATKPPGRPRVQRARTRREVPGPTADVREPAGDGEHATPPTT